MCLMIDNNKHVKNSVINEEFQFYRAYINGIILYEPKVAKEDIVCYKALKVTKDGIKSVIHDFEWNEGEIKEQELGGCVGQVRNGLHAITNPEIKYILYIKYVTDSSDLNHISSVYPGGIPIEEKWNINAKMIIPKGAKYYMGTQGDIVADKMKLVEFIS